MIYLFSLTDSDDRARAIIEAMESIEDDYESLGGVLPKSEYQGFVSQLNHYQEGDGPSFCWATLIPEFTPSYRTLLPNTTDLKGFRLGIYK